MSYNQLGDADYLSLIKNLLGNLFEVQPPNVILPIIGWFMACPLKPKIQQYFGGFPLLMVSGTRGAGKTSLLRLMWALFGFSNRNHNKLFSVTETPFMLDKLFSASTSIPILFLTSKDEEVDELLGLKLGADDFVKKSGGFSIKVLVERIRVQLRKRDNSNIEDARNIIAHGKLKLDPSQLECEWDGKPLPEKLTTTEFLIVKELAKRPGIIKERAQLMDIAYKDNNDIEDRTIDSHVKRIRKKFKKVDQNFSAIETRYGSGYRWNIS